MTEVKLKCDVCLWDIKNEFLYGEFLTSDKVNCHYFCLLSGTRILQKYFGKSREDHFHHFLHDDINNSRKFYQNVECFYCGQLSAAVECSFKGCDRAFHYPCGTRNNCMTVFSGKFGSFCNRHVPDRNEGKEHKAEYCLVCYELMPSYHPAESIISSCCLKLDHWQKLFLHKKCVLPYVKNAGYDSMCISCPMEDLSKEDWQEEMRQKGIFIPMQDAAWEQDEWFKSQSKRKCEMDSCPNKNKSYGVFTCFVCGCFPRHLKCASVNDQKDYYCPRCYDQSFVQRVPRD